MLLKTLILSILKFKCKLKWVKMLTLFIVGCTRRRRNGNCFQGKKMVPYWNTHGISSWQRSWELIETTLWKNFVSIWCFSNWCKFRSSKIFVSCFFPYSFMKCLQYYFIKMSIVLLRCYTLIFLMTYSLSVLISLI